MFSFLRKTHTIDFDKECHGSHNENYSDVKLGYSSSKHDDITLAAPSLSPQ